MNTITKQSYWAGTGKHQDFYDSAFETLVPDMGNAPTKEGEMLRAGCKLYYDYFNNGMCNNTSGAANFLAQSPIAKKVESELDKIYYSCNTGGYTSKNLELELEVVVDEVLEYIISKNGNYEPNSVDMYDFQEPDYIEEEEEEEEEYEDEDY